MKRYKPDKARANVGVSVGGGVISVEVSEAVIGPVIRITANLEAATIATYVLFKKVMIPSFFAKGNFTGKLPHFTNLIQHKLNVR